MSGNIIKEEAYTYVGTEMRKKPRRLNQDRRVMLRYEPHQDNRRVIGERRRGNTIWSQPELD